MKTKQLTIKTYVSNSMLLLVLLSMPTCFSQNNLEDGNYFIVNAASGRALVPVDGGINSNIRLKSFNKSGMQKWTVKKHVAKGNNGNEIVSYTIRNMASGYYLRPHHVPDNGNAILSGKDAYSNFMIEPDEEESFIIKNIKMGGDAMYSKNTGFSDDEPWFAPKEEDGNYHWQLIPIE